MFFLFGMRTKAKALGQLDQHCSKCARPTVQTLVETQKWFTLFFIPVIPLGRKQLIRCNLCGMLLKATPELRTQLAAKSMAAGA